MPNHIDNQVGGQISDDDVPRFYMLLLLLLILLFLFHKAGIFASCSTAAADQHPSSTFLPALLFKPSSLSAQILEPELIEYFGQSSAEIAGPKEYVHQERTGKLVSSDAGGHVYVTTTKTISSNIHSYGVAIGEDDDDVEELHRRVEAFIHKVRTGFKANR